VIKLEVRSTMQPVATDVHKIHILGHDLPSLCHRAWPMPL
jgi:hypothetical protein